jgi:tetratricopeptide (TPR) repeat protein
LIGLLKVKILANSGPAMRPLPRIAETLSRAVAEAEAVGLSDAAATGHFLLSVLHQEAGDTVRAQASSVRAAEAGRAADRTSQAHQFANTARCLIELETEIPQARALIQEAEALLGPAGDQLCELCWGRGLLQRWDGRTDSAAALIERALKLARDAEDRWREYKCLTWLALVEFELELYDAVRGRCLELLDVAGKLGESDGPFAHALDALAGFATGVPEALAALDTACANLRDIDDKTYLAYTLNAAAALHLKAGRTDLARAHAREAYVAARAMHRFGDMALAQATLARMEEDGRAAARDIGRLLEEACEGDRANARTRSTLLATATAIGLVGPTMASTRPRHNGR